MTVHQLGHPRENPLLRGIAGMLTGEAADEVRVLRCLHVVLDLVDDRLEHVAEIPLVVPCRTLAEHPEQDLLLLLDG